MKVDNNSTEHTSPVAQSRLPGPPGGPHCRDDSEDTFSAQETTRLTSSPVQSPIASPSPPPPPSSSVVAPPPSAVSALTVSALKRVAQVLAGGAGIISLTAGSTLLLASTPFVVTGAILGLAYLFILPAGAAALILSTTVGGNPVMNFFGGLIILGGVSACALALVGPGIGLVFVGLKGIDYALGTQTADSLLD